MGRKSLFLVFVLLAAPAADGQTIWDHGRGWQIEVPAGWSELSEGKRGQAHAISRWASPGVEFITGFSPTGTELDHPYILVQLVPARLEDASVEDLEKALGVKTMDKAARTAGGRLAGTISGIAVNEARFDRESRRALLRFEATLPTIGPIRGCSVGFPAVDGLVQFSYYDRAADFGAGIGAFESMVDSFRFDPGREWVPKEGPITWIRAIGVGVVAMIAVGVHQASRKRRSRGGRKGARPRRGRR